MIKDKTEYHRVDIFDLLNEIKASDVKQGLNIVNIRGCNGAGKSTVPMRMMAEDPDVFMITQDGKDIATVFPTFKYVAVGKYFTKTGGVDGVKNTDTMKKILSYLNLLPYHIIYEGILASTVFSTHRDILQQMESGVAKRKATILNIIPPFDLIRERILKRNGGNNNVKWEQIEGKYKTVKNNHPKFVDAGLNSIVVDNSEITLEETTNWFLNLVGE